MDDVWIGQSCALLTALTWASAMVLLKASGETYGPLPLNLFKNTLGLVLLGATLLVWRDGLVQAEPMSQGDVWVLLLSGFLGIAVADTLFLYALNLVGVGIQSIVDCSYSPLVILLSWWLLGERLQLLDYAGTGLVLSAVLVATRHTPPDGRTPGQMLLGIIVGLIAIALIAYAIVLAKPVLERCSVVGASILRLLAGTLPLLLWGLISNRKSTLGVFRPGPAWKTALPAGILGGYFSMVLWIAGFKFAPAGVAGALNQTSTIFAIALATLFLKEKLTRRKLIAVNLALAGVVLVTLP